MICAAPIGSGVHISKSIARFFEKFSGFLSGERRRKRVEAELIAKYREFDAYDLDEVVTPAFEIKTPRLLPSEPPGGITYRFGPSGYLSKNRNADYCVIHTQWKNVANYCHWTFCELPLLHLALASTAKYVVIPDALLDYTQPFQKRWFEILYSEFPGRQVIRTSAAQNHMNGIIPVNHDTSSSSILIGKCPYKFYHHARATPYCIQVVENLRKHMDLSQACTDEKIYINRRGRRLKNEREVQEYLVKKGFKILDLEYLTLDDQANIFANAAMIIGFHGAGFTNILFSGPRVSIVEIVDADCVYPSYLDGVVIPGKKATRTYFHLLACMKKLNYRVIETRDYQLSLDRLAEILP